MTAMKIVNVPLSEEEMAMLRTVAKRERRSLGNQFRILGIDRLKEAVVFGNLLTPTPTPTKEEGEEA